MHMQFISTHKHACHIHVDQNIVEWKNFSSLYTNRCAMFILKEFLKSRVSEVIDTFQWKV